MINGGNLETLEIGRNLVQELFLSLQVGPLLVTHWGLSGPVILRLSAWGARDLFGSDYTGMIGSIIVLYVFQNHWCLN